MKLEIPKIDPETRATPDSSTVSLTLVAPGSGVKVAEMIPRGLVSQTIKVLVEGQANLFPGRRLLVRHRVPDYPLQGPAEVQHLKVVRLWTGKEEEEEETRGLV